MTYKRTDFSGQPKPASLMDVVGTKNDGFLESPLTLAGLSNRIETFIDNYEGEHNATIDSLMSLHKRVSRLEQPWTQTISITDGTGKHHDVQVTGRAAAMKEPISELAEEPYCEGGVPDRKLRDLVEEELNDEIRMFAPENNRVVAAVVMGYLIRKGLLK